MSDRRLQTRHTKGVVSYFERVKKNVFLDQFSFLGNRARYEFIELDMSTVLALSIPSSRPPTMSGYQKQLFLIH